MIKRRSWKYLICILMSLFRSTGEPVERAISSALFSDWKCVLQSILESVSVSICVSTLQSDYFGRQERQPASVLWSGLGTFDWRDYVYSHLRIHTPEKVSTFELHAEKLAADLPDIRSCMRGGLNHYHLVGAAWGAAGEMLVSRSGCLCVPLGNQVIGESPVSKSQSDAVRAALAEIIPNSPSFKRSLNVITQPWDGGFSKWGYAGGAGVHGDCGRIIGVVKGVYTKFSFKKILWASATDIPLLWPQQLSMIYCPRGNIVDSWRPSSVRWRFLSSNGWVASYNDQIIWVILKPAGPFGYKLSDGT